VLLLVAVGVGACFWSLVALKTPLDWETIKFQHDKDEKCCPNCTWAATMLDQLERTNLQER
jgi:hypothetical protein